MRRDRAPGLYVHVPFCRSKCPYCDFYSVTASPPVSEYIEAVAREAALHRDSFGAFDTIYLGGGTPSSIGGDRIGELLELLRGGLSFTGDPETTIEVNPDDVTPQRAARWIAAGIDRVSIGVQSFSDTELALLGRRHSAVQAKRAVELLRETGFTNIGIDLIYGFRGQDWGSVYRSIETALRYEPEHISCYTLTVASGTAFHVRAAAGEELLLGEQLQGDIYRRISETLRLNGYLHYEVSSFARSGGHVSRHNSGYWDRTPYLGLGPAAHSFTGIERRWNGPGVEDYIRNLEEGKAPTAGAERLTPEEERFERLMLGFRTSSGVPVALIEEYRGWERVLEELVDRDLASVDDGMVKPTVAGYLVADRLPVMFTE